MPDFDELSHNLAKVASDDVNALLPEAAEAVDADEEKLAYFLAKAWMAGAHAGQVEVVAQMNEKGIKADIKMIRAPRGNEQN
jgi:hypothetical protein